MKNILFFLFSMVSCASFSQVLNGSFENSSIPDLSSWEWTCNSQSFNNAPPGGGNWSIKVFAGNGQGCFPGYAYQKIPSITNGQTFVLSGWGFAQASPMVGIYFGKINNGIITTQDGDTTSSTSWTQLSVQSSFNLSTGDTAVVVLYGGFTGGPVQGYGYFDLVNLQQVTGIYSMEQNQSIKIFPIPFSLQTTLFSNKIFKDATLTIYNSVGKKLKQIENLSGSSIVFQRDNLPSGLYFIHLVQDDKIIAKDKLIITDY